jgi:hypothetical protein
MNSGDDIFFTTVYQWCLLPVFIASLLLTVGILRVSWQKITHTFWKCLGGLSSALYGKTREEIKVNFTSKELGMSFHDEKKKLIVTDAVGEVK